MRKVSGKTIFPSFSIFVLFFISLLFFVTIFLSYKLLTRDTESLTEYRTAESRNNKHLPLLKHKLAVLVPFRNRFDELLQFAPYMHSFLTDQNIDHHIFILNQVDAFRFNRASLINVGYLQINEMYDYIAMHDVDLLPLNNELKYYYPDQPFHIASPKLHPRYHYDKFIGGILLINREQYQLVNGLSNKYWGWGLEDDEFYVRLKDAKLNITRPENISTNITNTFRHIHNKSRKRDTQKCYNQKESTRKRDRKTGLHDVQYNIISRNELLIDNAPVSVINIQLFCDRNNTPWCDCDGK